MTMKKVAVVGGGIIGVCSALRILKTVPDVHVTLMSENLTPDTTGDGSAGFVMPYALGEGTPANLVKKWSDETFEFFKEIALSEDSYAAGVFFIEAYWISETPESLTDYDGFLLHKTRMTKEQLSMFPPNFKYGTSGTSIMAECIKMLPRFMKEFQDKGGVIQKGRVNDLLDLSGSFDVVVNCTGLGAGKLVSDPEVYPVRGQVMKIKLPWIKYAVITPDFHVLPGSDLTTIGGTKQANNWSRAVNAEDKERIWNGCCSVIPSIKNAEVVKDWVGLRPTRNSVRLEKEVLQTGNRSIQVIHNYGHGGSGVTLCWGCAGDVVKLISTL